MLSITTKCCKICNIIKPSSEYYSRGESGRLRRECKICNQNAAKSRYKRIPRPRYPEYNREWAKNHPDSRKESADKQNLRIRLLKLGITEDDLKKTLVAQGGLCAICKQPETIKRFGVAVSLSGDHCHRSGKFRGLLCNNCNRCLGLMREDPDILIRAAKYLKERS